MNYEYPNNKILGLEDHSKLLADQIACFGCVEDKYGRRVDIKKTADIIERAFKYREYYICKNIGIT